MDQQIIIPWRNAGEAWRSKHFSFLYKYYSQYFDVILGDNSGEFNRSAARNTGVQEATSEIAVVIDADNYIPIDQIYSAIRVAQRRDILVKPFMEFGYLTEESTNNFYEKGPDKHNAEYISPPENNFTGGAYVMKKSLWIEIGGMDEGFIGWGAEDDAFHLSCKNRNIPTRYIEGSDRHLYHPAFRKTSEHNYNKLMKEYVNGHKPS